MSEHGGGGGEEKITPFILKRHNQEQTAGQCKRHKLDKQMHLDPMVLKEGNLDEIGYKVRDTMTDVLQQSEQKYMQMLGSIQKDLYELQILVNRIQVGVKKASGV